MCVLMHDVCTWYVHACKPQTEIKNDRTCLYVSLSWCSSRSTFTTSPEERVIALPRGVGLCPYSYRMFHDFTIDVQKENKSRRNETKRKQANRRHWQPVQTITYPLGSGGASGEGSCEGEAHRV